MPTGDRLVRLGRSIKPGEMMRNTLPPSFGSMARCALVLAMCGNLGACGLWAVKEEAQAYREAQALQTKNELEACLKKAKQPNAWNQAVDQSGEPDCYMAAIVGSARPLATRIESPGDARPATASLLANMPGPPASSPKPDHTDRVLTAAELAQVGAASEAVSQVAWMAMLSKMSYRRFVDTERRSDTPDACTYRLDLHPLPRLYAAGLQRSATGASIQERLRTERVNHWALWMPEDKGCRAVDGLFYETYVYREFDQDVPQGSEGRIAQAVVVFRGTEKHPSQRKEDWEANLALAFDRFSGQHKEVQRTLRDLVETLRGPDKRRIPIYATGHSLGGGLAQMAAYLRPEITAAYAFNTSPVTGWTQLKGEQRENPASPDSIQVEDPQIIRVMQDDEALGLPRLVSDAANSTIRRTGRTDLHLDFPASREAVRQTGAEGKLKIAGGLHSITLLACNLAARVERNSKTAAFGFTREMARAALADNQGGETQEGGRTQEARRAQEGLCQVVKHGKTEAEDQNCQVNWISASVNCKPAAVSRQ